MAQLPYPVSEGTYGLEAIGVIRSSLTVREAAPRRGTKGGSISLEPSFAEALQGVAVDDEVFMITRLHEARRDILKCTRGTTRAALSPAYSRRGRPTVLGTWKT